MLTQAEEGDNLSSEDGIRSPAVMMLHEDGRLDYFL